MYKLKLDFEAQIAGCPADGLPAIDFRLANGLTPEPSKLVFVHHHEIVTDEEFCRRYPQFLNQNADLVLVGVQASHYYGGYKQVQSNEMSAQAARLLFPHSYNDKFCGYPSLSPSVLHSYQRISGESFQQTISVLLDELLETAARRLATAEQKEREQAKAEQEREQARAARKAQDDEECAQHAARRQAGEAALKAWAEQHGSKLLKARLEEFEWLDLAETEYANAAIAQLEIGEEVPDPEDYSTVSTESCTQPELDEICALTAVREMIDNHEAQINAELTRVTYRSRDENDYDWDDSDRPEIERTELRLTVTMPTGATEQFFFLPSQILESASKSCQGS